MLRHAIVHAEVVVGCLLGGNVGVEVARPLFLLLNSTQYFRKSKQFVYHNSHGPLLDTFRSSHAHSLDRSVLI